MSFKKFLDKKMQSILEKEVEDQTKDSLNKSAEAPDPNASNKSAQIPDEKVEKDPKKDEKEKDDDKPKKPFSQRLKDLGHGWKFKCEYSADARSGEKFTLVLTGPEGKKVDAMGDEYIEVLAQLIKQAQLKDIEI